MHKKYALHRQIFEMRKMEMRRKEQGAKAKEVSKGLWERPTIWTPGQSAHVLTRDAAGAEGSVLIAMSGSEPASRQLMRRLLLSL
jgi:hypothetical protein